ncbi:primary-amine oxidase [Herbiconiux daphne]|uniref:Amine oxidase n=1 Tax=Herbiconiux daphne TaxID=2970914 RepID=A0ABT2H730_9MICO|nr:primary-amine oxidase [Herbiconiux daphne]MCS5735683.1 primary-amine oxidase [Herbiconiux daphne]
MTIAHPKPALDPIDAVHSAHPLSPLSPAEIRAAKELLVSAGKAGPQTRYSYVSLREPEKADVLAYAGGELPTREVSILLTDLDTQRVRTVIVDVTRGELVHEREIDTSAEGFGPALDADFTAVDEIVKADEEWVAAIARRGITDLDRVRTVPLSAGVFDHPDEIGRRMYRVLAFEQKYETDSMWAHPIDGVVAHVDVGGRSVLRVVENHIRHVPQESGDYLDPTTRGAERTDLKPISITQPEGASFALEDGLLTWQNWSVRLGYNGREGLTLHQLSFTDAGVLRPILYRGSVSEMVVNYGEPTPMHNWQNYFDVGEYQFGRLANSLELGCDCLGEISYVDAIVADDFGDPQSIRNAICIHEEDYGILWKHTDMFSGTSETRRQRRLVVSFFVTVGNYDYGFYWYLYLDGTIELEGKATGIVFTGGHDGSDPYSSRIAPGLGAPVHQHLFSARLDLDIDGTANQIDELEFTPVPMGDGNPHGNAISRSRTPLRTEGEAQRLAANHLGRVWAISSTERRNRLGEPTTYVLHPEGQPVLLADPASSVARRAEFARKNLWVTRYDRDELWAAGYTINQHPGGAGLPAYAQGDRELDAQDLVIWHTFGLTHVVRLEDWPIMPVDYTGFTLKPHGFFDRNPTLDVPDLSTRLCHADRPGGHDAHHHHP